MIRARIYRNQAGIVQGFLLSGHANYAESGSDIVCAAASMLVINTINSIEKFTAEPMALFSDEKKGIIRCDFPDRKEGVVDEQAELLIKTMILGLEGLTQQYGNYIKLTEEAPQ